MSKKIANIAKNTSYFTIALILQKVVSFSYFVIIARALGPDDLGKYYFAISFTTMFAILIDLGFANVLTREVAKNNDDAEKMLGSILAMKIPLAFLSFITVSVLINLLGYPGLTKDLVYLSSISMILDSFTLTFFSTARGFHNLLYESIASIIFQLIVLITGVAVIYYDGGLRLLFLALVAASVFNFFYSLLLVNKKLKIAIKPVFELARIKYILAISASFTMFAVLQRIYTYLDSVLLSMLAGDASVGLYQVAFKIIFALQFLPMAFTASLYPAMSLYWIKNKGQLATTFERALTYLIIISLPISIGIIASADKIILLFKSGYSDAILPLQITIASVFFNFINFPIGSLLNACDRQKNNTANMGIVLAASVFLNLILIPKFGAVGASITVLSTTILMSVLGLGYVPKILTLNPKGVVKTFIKSLSAALAMASIIMISKSYMNIFLVVLVSGIIYFILLLALKAFRKEDILSIIDSFKKKPI